MLSPQSCRSCSHLYCQCFVCDTLNTDPLMTRNPTNSQAPEIARRCQPLDASQTSYCHLGHPFGPPGNSPKH
ncbi:hypothetical protein J6590_079849 [Homalodisca vitripennis]|nr:hypothetical protein J6590_079849 [Homalodisca vitripennis]